MDSTLSTGSTGWVSVELLSHSEVLQSGSSFYVHARLFVSAVLPSSGPVSGGTRLAVVGLSFRESATLRCRLGSRGMSSVARLLSSSQLECASPASSSAGARRISLSANGQQFSLGAAMFSYRPSAAVSCVWPVRGASEGGTPVTVLGSGFSSSAEALGGRRCLLGGAVRLARCAVAGARGCNSTRGRAGAHGSSAAARAHPDTRSRTGAHGSRRGTGAHGSRAAARAPFGPCAGAPAAGGSGEDNEEDGGDGVSRSLATAPLLPAAHTADNN